MTKKQSILPAIILILIGMWFLAGNLGIKLPNLGQLWPGFVMLGGVVALWSYYSGEDTDPGQIFVGLAALGVGAFFFLFTLNLQAPILGRVAWSDMGRLWPAFLLIGGVAFIGQFILSGFKDPGLLVPGVLALGVGLISFAFTLGFLSQTLGQQIVQLWPLALIILGLGLLITSIFRRR